jgi:hypothetical protein
MRQINVTVGPLVAASANNIATTQTPSAAGQTATVTFTNSSASITGTQTFVAGQLVYFTTTGQLPYPLQDIPGTPVNDIPPTLISGNVPYYVSSTGLSGAAFQVSGNYGGTVVTINTGAVGTSGLPGFWPAATGTQTVNYGGTVALNGTLVNSAGVAVLDTPRRVLITTADTTHKFTVTGTGPTGVAQSEVVGPITSTAYTNLDYATVTSIAVNGTLTAAVTVGTNGVASTPWVKFDEWANGVISIQCDATGTVNYTIQSTLDPMDNPNPAGAVWINTNDPIGVGATGSIQTNFQFPPAFARVLLNSGTGSVFVDFVQQGSVTY